MQFTQKRLIVTREMPPPQLVVKVLSPGKRNRQRDLVNKRAQYAAIAIPEYRLIDLQEQTMTVLILNGNEYEEVGVFAGDSAIVSPTFPPLDLTAKALFRAIAQ